MKFLILLLFPIVAYTQIITKTGSFQLNDYVDLQTGDCSNAELTSEIFQFVYDCSTSAEKKDLFLNYYNNYSLCICPCISGAIGSARPFYRFKKELKYLPLNTTLRLDDTAAFQKIDTISEHEGKSSCLLPFYVWDDGNPNELILIMTTSANKYALVILAPVYKQADCNFVEGNPPKYYHSTYTTLSGYNATWYIQWNGSPSFQGVDIRTGVVCNPVHHYPRKLSHDNAGYYTLLGRKVPMVQVQRKALQRGTPSLYVVEERGGMRLVIR